MESFFVWDGNYQRFLFFKDDSCNRTLPAGKNIETRCAGGPPVARILVVDDEPMIRDLLKEMLISIGYEVQTAQDGMAALEYYRRHKDQIDLVILDVMMPGMSGVEVFRRLKEIDPEVKTILASGYVERSQLNQAMQEGIKDFIAKPFALATLKRKLETIFA